MNVKMPGLYQLVLTVRKVNCSTPRRKVNTGNPGGKREVTKVTVCFGCFSQSSHPPILISMKRKGSSPHGVRESVHELVAG